MSASAPSVGRSVPRLDGAAKVTGVARYVDDLPPMAGELSGVTVRSPVARGALRAVGFDPSFDWSGVTRVVAGDIAGLAPAGAGVNLVALIAEDQPVLASKALNHAYEPVVLLAAEVGSRGWGLWRNVQFAGLWAVHTEQTLCRRYHLLGRSLVAVRRGKAVCRDRQQLGAEHLLHRESERRFAKSGRQRPCHGDLRLRTGAYRG